MKKRNVLSILLAALCCTCCLFAACKAKVNVTLEANGGNISTAAIEVVKGEKINLSDYNPTRDGYEFEGWYSSPDFSGDSLKRVTVEEDCTFYAKWAQYATVNFDLNGGTLGVSSVKAPVGTKIKDLVKDYVPELTVEGTECRFASWYADNRQLSDSATLSAAGVTLTAKYQYKYSVEIKVQSLTESGKYESNENYPVVTGFADEGATISAPSYEGLTVKSSTITKIVKGNNSFVVNYDRKSLNVTFDHNDGTSDKTRESVLFGNSIEVLGGLERDGYLLVGWSTEKDGAVAYSVDSISEKLYGGTGEGTAAQSFTPAKNVTLYAKWTKGLTDMFGGSDVMYVFDTIDENGEEAKNVYLYRGGYFFEGKYVKRDGSIKFEVNKDTGTVLQAYLVNNDTGFAFRDNTRKQTYHEYSLNFGATSVSADVNENVKLEIDEGSGFTYTVTNDGTDSVSKGYYVINGGEYELNFTEGELAGEKRYCVWGTLSGSYVFWQRNDADYGQKILRYVVSNGALQAISETYGYYLVLSGYSTATMVVGSQSQSFYYNFNGEFIDLYSSSTGTKQGSFKIIERDDVKGYIAYDSSIDNEFLNGTETFETDGSYSATYKDAAGNTYKGVYVQDGTSVLGGTIVKFWYGTGLTKTFVLTTVKGEKVNTYTFSQKADGYAEYYFVQGNSIYQTPIFVLNESEEGELVVYGLTENKTYVKIAYGDYEKNDDGNYVFKNITLCEENVDNLFKSDENNIVWDFSGITSVTFEIDTDSASSPFIYWYKVEKGDVVDDKRVTYTDVTGKTSLILTGIFAEFKKGENVYEGMLVTDEDSGISVLSAGGSYFYFEIDTEAKTYVLYQSAPYTAYAITKNGGLTAAEYISSDGKGGATYYYTVEAEGDGESTTVPVEGTVTATDEKAGSVTVYEFKANEDADADKNFRFVVLIAGNYYAFAKKSSFGGTYTAEDGSTLTLDGYVTATYVYGGRTFENAYYFETEVENQVLFVYSNGTVSLTAYFDVKSDNTFTMRGTEYGTFMRLDNQGISGMSFEFDGYGNAIVRDYERDSNGEFVRDDDNNLKPVDVDLYATYELKTINGRTYIIVTYKANESTTVEIKAILSSVTSGSSTVPVLIVVHSEVEETYVDPSDWSVLIVTSYGTATHIDGKTGVTSTGSYMIITEENGKGLLYFSASSTNASVYRYDTNKKSISKPNYGDEKGYYSEDLSALYFSTTGYATYAKGDSGISYYYDVDKDSKNVTLYHQNWYEAGCNEYGFIAEDFGEFKATKVWKDDTYYSAGGQKVTFKRTDSNKQLYPVSYDTNTKGYFGDITFIPNGKDAFSVAATIELLDKDGNPLTDSNDKAVTLSGKVVREVLEGDVKHTYVSLTAANGGSFLFDIALSFKGVSNDGDSNSSYTISSMELEIGGSGYIYNNAMIQVLMQMLQGYDTTELMAQAEKYNYGDFTFGIIYDENGEAVSKRLKATLTENSPLKDEEGNLWTFDGETTESRTTEDGETIIVLEGTDVFEAVSNGYKLKLSDGKNKYTAIVAFRQLQYFSGVGFYFHSINAVSELDASYGGTDYKVTVERIVASDLADADLGTIYSAKICDKDGTELEMSYGYYKYTYDAETKKTTVDRDSLYYIVRTKAEGSDKYNKESKIFYLQFFGGETVGSETSGSETSGSETSGSETGEVEGEEKQKKYGAYDSVQLVCYDAEVVYNAEGTEYIDVMKDGENKTIVARTTEKGDTYLAYECEYSETDGGYKVLQSNGTEYVVVFNAENGTYTLK